MKTLTTQAGIAIAAASVFMLMCAAANAAEPVAAAATSASHAKVKKAAAPAKAAQVDECKTTSNNPMGKTDEGGNVLVGKKPSGPKCPQDKIATPAAK